MLKKGIFHPQFAKALAEQRHMDRIVIGDAGLPVPDGVQRIDLGWRAGDPKFLDVLEETLKWLVIEGAIFATEARSVSLEAHEKALALLPDQIDVSYLSHNDLKVQMQLAKTVVLTGEFTPFINVILVSGCPF